SYGGGEFSGEDDSAYDHPGVVVTVSTGDSGYGVSFPAASPHVVAVGGTSLTVTNPSPGVFGYGGETVWNGAGSGCSACAPAPAWQTAMAVWSTTACGTKRADADVSAVADPNTGVAIYDNTPYYGGTGWYQIGGTSLSAPLVAAVYALAGGAGGVAYPA